MKLSLQKFIEEHDNWESLLKEKPYCLEIKRDNMFGMNLILFKYNQIESDFSELIVKECRGLVLNEDTHEVVVFPFTKFFNYNEQNAAKIDWNTAKVSQKLDGSICKVVKIGNDDLLIGTNSNIDTFKAPLAEQNWCKSKSFGELILEGISYYGLNKNSFAKLLEHDKTYIFELTSPFNQVVVRWNETKLNLIGIRDNKTFKEQKFEEHDLANVFNTPKLYDLNSVEDCVNAAKELPDSEEGYVVRDDDFNRIKIKSPKYLQLHAIAGNGVLSIERAIEIVKTNEIDEVVSYFPNFKNKLFEVKSRMEKLCDELDDKWKEFESFEFVENTRKEHALWIIKNFKVTGFAFCKLNGKVKDAKEWILSFPNKNLKTILGL